MGSSTGHIPCQRGIAANVARLEAIKPADVSEEQKNVERQLARLLKQKCLEKAADTSACYIGAAPRRLTLPEPATDELTCASP